MKHHALVVPPTRGFGHINPMLELCVLLGPFGFRVSFLIAQQNHGKVQERLSALRSRAQHIELVSTDGVLIGSPEMDLDSSVQAIVTAANHLVPRVTCIISDVFVVEAEDAADKLGVPRAAFWTGSTASEAIFRNISKLQSSGFVPLEGTGKEDEVIPFLPGMPHFQARHLPFCLGQNGCVINFLRDANQRSSEALCVLVNTVEDLEKEPVAALRSTSRNYFPIGPLVPSQEHGNEHFKDVFNWLNNQRPASVLYVAFGSETFLPLEQAEKLVEGLKASQQPVLWAFRDNSVVGAPAGYHESTRVKLSGQGLVVAWVPQMAVLKHPAVGGFLTHCGWNSTLEAICCGVPTLCWPCAAEQNLNAYMMVETWKIGLLLCSKFDGHVTVERIKNLVQELLTGNQGREMKGRTASMAASALGALQRDGSSHKNLRDFVSVLENRKDA